MSTRALRFALLGVALLLPSLAVAAPARPARGRADQHAATTRKPQHKLLAARAAHRDVQPQIARARKPAKPQYPAVSLYEPNLRETLVYRPYDDKGRPRAAAARELVKFLRDHHTGKRHAVHPRLGPVIYDVARHFGRPLEIYSGYRPPQFSQRAKSRHLTGAAVDFAVPGVANEAVIKYLRSKFHPVGVGYYPKGVHVHLDVDRTEDTYWVDTGETPAADAELETTQFFDTPAMSSAAPRAVTAAPAGEPAEMDDGPGLHDAHEGPEIDPCFLR